MILLLFGSGAEALDRGSATESRLHLRVESPHHKLSGVVGSLVLEQQRLAREAGLRVKKVKVVPEKGLLSKHGMLLRVGDYEEKTGTLTLKVSVTALEHPGGFRGLQTGSPAPRGNEWTPPQIEMLVKKARKHLLLSGKTPSVHNIGPTIDLLVAAASRVSNAEKGVAGPPQTSFLRLGKALKQKYARGPDLVRIENLVERIANAPGDKANWQRLKKVLREEQGGVTNPQAIQLLESFSALDFPSVAKRVEGGQLVRDRNAMRLADGLGFGRREVYKHTSDRTKALEAVTATLRETVARRPTEDLARVFGDWVRARLSRADRGTRVLVEAGSRNLQEFAQLAPELAGIMLDSSRADALLEVLSVVRTVLEPSSSKAKGLTIPIAKNLSLEVDTGSFRKHRLVTTDRKGRPIATAEVKMPGDLLHKREVFSADYHVGHELKHAPGLAGRVRTAALVLTYPPRKRWRYGQQVEFTEEVPERLIVSIHDPGKPRAPRLSEYLKENKLSPKQVTSLVGQLGDILRAVTAAGWTGGGELATLHNFDVEISTGGRLKLWLVNDFGGYQRIVGDEGVGSVLTSHANLRESLSKNLPGIDLTGLLPTQQELLSIAERHDMATAEVSSTH